VATNVAETTVFNVAEKLIPQFAKTLSTGQLGIKMLAEIVSSAIVVEPILAVIDATASVNVKIFALTIGVTDDLLSRKISNIGVTGVYVKTLAVAVACFDPAVVIVPSAVISSGGAVGMSVASASFKVVVPSLNLNRLSGDGVTALTLLFLTLRTERWMDFCSSTKKAGLKTGIVLSPSKNLPLETSRNSS
jgi:hypothetical protein